MPSKGDAAEKRGPKTVRAAQRWFSNLQVLEKLIRDKDPPLQPLCPTQIYPAFYVLEDISKGWFGSGSTIPKEVSYDMEYGPGKVHARHGVWCEEHQSKSSNKREMINTVEVIE